MNLDAPLPVTGQDRLLSKDQRACVHVPAVPAGRQAETAQTWPHVSNGPALEDIKEHTFSSESELLDGEREAYAALRAAKNARAEAHRRTISRRTARCASWC